MNQTSAYVQETPGGGFYAMVRYPQQAEAHPVRQWCETEGKLKAKRYASRVKAQEALIEWLLGLINGRMTGTADGIHRSNADEIERVFGGFK